MRPWIEASLRINIAVGRPNMTADDVSLEDVEAAARAASAHDFISSFPQGYGRGAYTRPFFGSS